MRNSVGDVQDRYEYDLSLSVEMHPVHRRIRLPTYAFVEFNVVFVIYVVLVSQPESLVSVDEVPLPHLPLHLLCFAGLGFLLDLEVIPFLFGLLGSCLLLDFLFLVHVDGEVNELGVSSHKFGDFLSVEELKSIFLEVNSDYGASPQGVSGWIWLDCEGSGAL